MKSENKKLLQKRAKRAMMGLHHNGNYRTVAGVLNYREKIITPDAIENVKNLAAQQLAFINKTRKIYYSDDPRLVDEEIRIRFLENERYKLITRYGTVRTYGKGDSTIAPENLISERYPRLKFQYLEGMNVEELTMFCLIVEDWNRFVARETIWYFNVQKGVRQAA